MTCHMCVDMFGIPPGCTHHGSLDNQTPMYPTDQNKGARPRRLKHRSDRERKFRGQPEIALIQFYFKHPARGRINKNTALLLQPVSAPPRTTRRIFREASPVSSPHNSLPPSPPSPRDSSSELARQVRLFLFAPLFVSPFSSARSVAMREISRGRVTRVRACGY
jgi:hypothetical protein